MNTESPVPQQVTHTACCIVGGGPAGMMLALLLVWRGVAVTVLEAHNDFDRQFRGNTINPAAMRVLDQLGLLDDVLRLRHAKVRRFIVQTVGGALCFADFSRLRVRYPFIMMLPQQKFLESLADALACYPHARLVMNARVQELIGDNGVVRGARYHAPDGWHDVRADLTVGADGRFSRVRKLAGLAPLASWRAAGCAVVQPAALPGRP